ncbi:copper resistance protein B [Spirulina major]|uniref:copper resistance protein B n=1 Tax=Spirulina major TaxID=270636 RepID=UPI000A04E82D|nr:copper resistance protein B [Spirulina major]
MSRRYRCLSGVILGAGLWGCPAIASPLPSSDPTFYLDPAPSTEAAHLHLSTPEPDQVTPELPPLPDIHPHGDRTYWFLRVEQLEYRVNEGDDSLNWDLKGWIGGDYTRLWLKAEGEVNLDPDEGGEFEVQLLHSRLISPFFEVQAGLRYDREFGTQPERDRLFGVIGLHGLAPYFIETDAALFISESGDLSARLTAERSLLLSQRLILQPDLEINLAAQTVEKFGVGSGLNDVTVGLRLRYEFTRRFAPYVGVNWSRKFGATATFARAEQEEVDNWAIVGGVNLLF